MRSPNRIGDEWPCGSGSRHNRFLLGPNSVGTLSPRKCRSRSARGTATTHRAGACARSARRSARPWRPVQQHRRLHPGSIAASPAVAGLAVTMCRQVPQLGDAFGICEPCETVAIVRARIARPALFPSQCDQRVELRGAARGQHRCDERHHRQQRRDRADRHRIAAVDLDQQLRRFEDLPDAECAGDADGQPDRPCGSTRGGGTARPPDWTARRAPCARRSLVCAA